MKRLLAYFYLLSLIIVISGCTIQSTCEVYNNTGKDLKIIQLKYDGGKLERAFKVNSRIRLEGWWGYTYQVAAKDTVWNYRLVEPDVDFIVFEGTKRLFRIQLEKDGHIYILQAGQSFPASKFPKQPEGFPLLPKEE